MRIGTTYACNLIFSAFFQTSSAFEVVQSYTLLFLPFAYARKIQIHILMEEKVGCRIEQPWMLEKFGKTEEK